MAIEQTLILVKPDAFSRGLTGEIIARFERKGLKILQLQKMTLTEGTAKEHYAEHDGKPFFGELVEFITSGPLVAMVLEGEDAIKAARQVIGATNPLEATTGSIRGDYAIQVGTNMVHGSDSPESGQREASSSSGRLILASRSPQRTAILDQLGYAHVVEPADVEELTQGDPREVALENARRKAGGRPDTLGVDTLVALGDVIFGKPGDEAEACATLLSLSDQTHRVISGLVYEDEGVTVTTEVTFRDIASMVDAYVATGEWEGRAGGYAIQGRGAALVRGIRGDYLNVVGLPASALWTCSASRDSVRRCRGSPR